MNHTQAERLLPWLANASLSIDESQAVRAHVQRCCLCAADLQAYLTVREVVRETAAEQSWCSESRVRRAAAQLTLKKAPALKTLAEALRNNLPVAPFARVAVVVQLVLILGLTWQRGYVPHLEATYQTAVTMGAAELQLMFVPHASEAQIRSLLLDVQASITDGPSALGLYGIRFLDDQPIERRREHLTKSSLVRYAQSRLQQGEHHVAN